jgi:hypothetical protein
MKCPACQGPTSAVQTIPAEKRQDGRVYRVRKCRSSDCGVTHSTLEILHSEAKGGIAPYTPPSPPPKAAIPTANPSPVLYDLEGELEKSLPLAVEVLADAVRPGTSPDKVKVDVAKWLLDDRRKWRIAMAEQSNLSGETPEDPAVAQLANILRLVE